MIIDYSKQYKSTKYIERIINNIWKKHYQS